MNAGDRVNNAVLGAGTVMAINGECAIGIPSEEGLITSSSAYPIAVKYEKYSLPDLKNNDGLSFNSVHSVDGYSQGNGAISTRQRPLKKLNAVLFYGQSLQTKTESERKITNAAIDGCLMVGSTVYGEWSDGGGFVASGSEDFYPLTGSDMESVAVGCVNELKARMNTSKQVTSDLDHIYVTMALGVGARTIQQCLSGDAWTRFTTGLTKLVNLASSKGYELCVTAIVYMQGEDDAAANATYSYYYSQLGVLKSQINSYIKSLLPSNSDVDFFLSQTGSSFSDDLNMQEVPKAQMDFCRDNDDFTMVGPYQYFPSKEGGSHMVANAYRWYGASIAKIIHQKFVKSNPKIFRISSVNVSSYTISVNFDVPYPPLKFNEVWFNKTSTVFADKGFIVVDSTGTLSGSDLTVAITGSSQVTITVSRYLTGDAYLVLGDKTIHKGKHNICDSDPALSIYNWEITGDSSAPDAIPTLAAKQYLLSNWCGLDRIKIL